MRKIIGIILMAFAALMSGCSGHQDDDATKIIVPGSEMCEDVLGVLAMDFNRENPESEVIVPEDTGTSGGIKAACNGKYILGRIGRSLEGDELNRGLAFLPFAGDAIVFVVGKGVGIRNLTADQLADIFSGKITNWKDLGGVEGPVRVLIRQPNNVALNKIRKTIGPFKDIHFSDQAKCAFHNHEMIYLLNKFPTSIGFMTNSSITAPDNTMKAIGIDGAIPTYANLLSGSYPLMTTYGLVYQKKKLNDTAMKFIDFIFSEKGKQIIEDHGLVFIARNK